MLRQEHARASHLPCALRDAWLTWKSMWFNAAVTVPPHIVWTLQIAYTRAHSHTHTLCLRRRQAARSPTAQQLLIVCQNIECREEIYFENAELTIARCDVHGSTLLRAAQRSDVQLRGRRCEALPSTGRPRICEDNLHRYELRKTSRDLHLPRTSDTEKLGSGTVLCCRCRCIPWRRHC